MMNSKVEQKISDLIQWSKNALSDSIAEDAMNNSRKAGEALCKAIILNHYGEAQGEQIILGVVNYKGAVRAGGKELDFNNLITTVTQENPPDSTIIQHKGTRHRVRAYLETIRTHGNSASHDPNSPKDKIQTHHLDVTRATLRNLLKWLFEDYLSIELPATIASLVLQSQSTADTQLIFQHFSPYEELKSDLKGWFEALDYTFTEYSIDTGDHFIWIIEEETRRGTLRILVYGLTVRISLQMVKDVQELVQYHNCDEGWIVTNSIVDKAAIAETESQRRRTVNCYTFDELLEETINFSNYFEWLEKEVKSRKIDECYIPLACEYTELDFRTNKLIAKSKYCEPDGWIDGYVDAWLHDHRKEHLSILGEFGTGKTWFALHYAWKLLQDYLTAKEKRLPRHRVPILIPLRDFSKAVEVETLISDFFFRKHKIQIQGAFSAFNQLNKMGKLLLIFDGFYEMSDKVDRQKMIDNFWQLATIITGKSKVILTCRNEHFPQIKEGRQLLNAELKMTTKHLTGNAPQFEVIQLLRFELSQIEKLLSFHTDRTTVKKIMANEELTDLLSRPIMTELVIDALDDIQQGKPIDMSRIYLYATKRKMERDIKQERTFTSLGDKLYFLCELSWQMLSSDKLVINYKEFSDSVRGLFEHIEDKDIDYWRYDMRGQSLLIIDEEDGNYKPAHKSLLEFFVAVKFAAHLGILADDFIDVARTQSYIDINQEAVTYAWEEYFRRDTDLTGEVVSIAPLSKFQTSSFNTLINIIGKAPLTRAIIDLIMGMISLHEETAQQTLLSIIELCKKKDFEEVGYLVSNLALLLLEYKHDFFKGKDFSSLCIRDLRFPVSNYTPGDNRRRERFLFQKGADVSGTQFQNSDLGKVNFGSPMLHYVDFKNTNFSYALLDDFKFHTTQLDEMTLIESENILALTSPRELILINIDTFKVEKRLFDAGGVWHINISPDKKYLFQSRYGGFKIRNLKSLDTISDHILSPQRNPNASDPDNLSTSCFAFVGTSNLLIVGRVNGCIHLIDVNTQEDVSNVNSFTGLSNLSVSPCGNFFVSSGFREFILWDIETLQKLKFEQSSEELKKYNAQFHPIKSQFVLVDGNRVRFFDTTSMNFYHELQLGDGDIWSELDCLAFSREGDKLFVASRQTIYVIDYHQKTIIQTIHFSDDQFPSSIQEPYSSAGITDIAVDSTGQTLYVSHHNRCATKVNVDTGEILNIYWHICDFTGANFTGAKGLTKDVMEQLKKNGAIV